VLALAPDILLAEFASLVAKHRRRKLISAGQADGAFALMKRCAPRLLETRPRLERALALSLEYQLSLWDSIYLAVGQEYECPL
jgi:predicted nucleic acid-binding protein